MEYIVHLANVMYNIFGQPEEPKIGMEERASIAIQKYEDSKYKSRVQDEVKKFTSGNWKDLVNRDLAFEKVKALLEGYPEALKSHSDVRT
jgi:hypothetical protein